MSLQTHDLEFSAVIDLPDDFEVYDFTQGYNPNRKLRCAYGIGKYDEIRPGMYKGDNFEKQQRNIHMGIDIAAPVGTAVKAFFDGQVFCFGDNARQWDYGPTIITVHELHGTLVYALHGHLSRRSLEQHHDGKVIQAGEVIGWVGDKHENGGWNPHLHFQLSLIKPETYDLPGVVNESRREWARQHFPDPRLVLGPLYEG